MVAATGVTGVATRQEARVAKLHAGRRAKWTVSDSVDIRNSDLSCEVEPRIIHRKSGLEPCFL